jgi:hypothetical protein
MYENKSKILLIIILEYENKFFDNINPIKHLTI